MTLGYLSTHKSQAAPTHKKVKFVEESTVSATNTANTVYWVALYFGISSLLSFTFLGITATTYEARHSYIIPALLGIAFMISCLSWLQTMLSMNLLKERTLARTSALLLYILASVSFFASSLAVMQQNWVLQFLCSLSGSIIGWLAFITIFEGEFAFPSKQQFGALAQILVLSFLWECRTFMVNMHFQ
tara:strand:- start:4449 stop:5012 length:564 start_codon:yes stop_codon:yes gene_type:complete